MSDLPDQLLPRRLRSWAQNEVMIDHYYTAHGRDCHQAADEIERLRAEIERMRKIEDAVRRAYILTTVNQVEHWDALNELDDLLEDGCEERDKEASDE